MTNLPQGTVTFAFTDIEGSTSLLKALGAAYADLLAEHRRLLRGAFSEHGGSEIDTQGDAFFFAFARASDAVAAAVAMQRAHAEHGWPGGTEVRIRVGLHTGEPTLGADGYVGLDVVRAARLCGTCRGGQVLLSQTTRALVGSTLPAGVDVYPLGQRRLKDIDEPEVVFELEIEGVERTAADEPDPSPVAAEPPAPPPPAKPPAAPRSSKQREADLERRIEEWALDLSEGIERKVLGKLERAFGGKAKSAGATSPPPSPEEDPDLDAVAQRGAALSREIQERIARAFGSSPRG